MPELPEVQTIVDELNREGIAGNRIGEASVRWPKTIAIPSSGQFRKQIKGKRISCIRRRGKFIIFDLSDGLHLAIHLRMSGRLDLTDDRVPPGPHVQVVLDLDVKKRLMYHDTRKFGRFYLTPTIGDVIGHLGPEPLDDDFTAKTLGKLLGNRKRQIKPLLLDQTFLAGLGNIYVDEALWRSGIHPVRAADRIRWPEVKSLHRAIRYVLRQGIRNRGTSLGKGLANYYGPLKQKGGNSQHLKVFRRTGRSCYKCGHPIERMVVGQRGTHICCRCQK